MSSIRRNSVEAQEVVETWKSLCNDKTYFNDFIFATHEANKEMAGKLQYGQQSDNAEEIGEWCQAFWEALPDSPSIHGPTFTKICDIAEWWCFGED